MQNEPSVQRTGGSSFLFGLSNMSSSIPNEMLISIPPRDGKALDEGRNNTAMRRFWIVVLTDDADCRLNHRIVFIGSVCILSVVQSFVLNKVITVVDRGSLPRRVPM